MYEEDKKIKLSVPIEFSSNNVEVTIRIVNGREPILAFVQLDFGLIKVKGITVKSVDFKKDGNPKLILDFPAYRTGSIFSKSVFITDKRIYAKLSEEVITEINERNLTVQTEINFDEIPF